MSSLSSSEENLRFVLVPRGCTYRPITEYTYLRIGHELVEGFLAVRTYNNEYKHPHIAREILYLMVNWYRLSRWVIDNSVEWECGIGDLPMSARFSNSLIQEGARAVITGICMQDYDTILLGSHTLHSELLPVFEYAKSRLELLGRISSECDRDWIQQWELIERMLFVLALLRDENTVGIFFNQLKWDDFSDIVQAGDRGNLVLLKN